MSTTAANPAPPDPDPLVRRDSAGNLAPIAQFSGPHLTAYGAAQHFAALATPEPRRARDPDGSFTETGGEWKFRLVGGHRTYLMTCDRKYGHWRVYMLPRPERRPVGS